MASAFHRYLEDSKTPLTNLVFYLPWLILYELGLWGSGDSYRNLASTWLREVLQWAGFSQYFLLPVLSCAVLLAWHHLVRLPWRVYWHGLPGMFLECMLYAALLLGMFQLQQVAVDVMVQLPYGSALATLDVDTSLDANVHLMLSMVGAGIYEELFFRLLLLPVVIWVLLRIELKDWLAYGLGVVIVSAVFAAAHSIGAEQDWFTFTFRFLVGVVLATVFLKRGFGIAVGVHALYNISVALMY